MWISILVHLLRFVGVAEGGEAAGEKGSEARFLFSRAVGLLKIARGPGDRGRTEDWGRRVGAHATMRLSSLSWVKLPTRLCVTLVGFCACEGRAGIRGWSDREVGTAAVGFIGVEDLFARARVRRAAARAGRRSRVSGFFDGDETYRHDVVVRHRCSDPPSGSRAGSWRARALLW